MKVGKKENRREREERMQKVSLSIVDGFRRRPKAKRRHYMGHCICGNTVRVLCVCSHYNHYNIIIRVISPRNIHRIYSHDRLRLPRLYVATD